jgi:PKD repeat protein
VSVRAQLRIGGVLLGCALLASCKESELTDTSTQGPQEPQDANAFFDADGAAVQVVDATSADDWVYVDLDTFSVVTPAAPADDQRWDLAIRRFVVKLNGGSSGTAGVAVAAERDTALLEVGAAPADGYVSDRALEDLSDDELLELGDNPFFSVCAPGHDDPASASWCLAGGTVDRDHLNADEEAYAFLTEGSGVTIDAAGEAGDALHGWYDYYPDENHLLRPAGDAWIVRTTDAHEIGVEILGYYGYEEGEAEAGTVAFRFVSLTPDFDIPEPGAQQLVASIEADPTSGAVPLEVAFAGSATGVEGTAAWHWAFGDGAESDARDPQHLYAEAGTYTATLNVTDDRGAGAAASASVVIVASATADVPPVADAGPDQTIMLADGETQATVTLDGSGSHDPDGAIATHAWSGSPDPDDVERPQLTLGAGSYVFTLTVTDDDGNSAGDTVTITVVAPDNTPPTAHIDVDTEQGPVPLAVQFSGTGSEDSDGLVVAYEWDFGDGSPRVGTAEASHSYTLAGTYTATLTVTDDRGAVATAGVTITATLRAAVARDTFVYEFLGNQADPAGDSHGILVWNHESNHGAKALIGFDDALATDPALVAAESYGATLWLYSTCAPTGFVEACAGDADADNPFTPGTATVQTDFYVQHAPWVETDVIAWDDIDEGPSEPAATLVQSEANRWYSVDVTDFVAEWVAAGTTGEGIALNQERWPVVRTDAGGVAVAAFCDGESSQPECDEAALGFDPRPYVEVIVAP